MIANADVVVVMLSLTQKPQSYWTESTWRGTWTVGRVWRWRRHERPEARKGKRETGAKIEGVGGRETGKNCPGSGTGSGEIFCGRRASLFNDYNVRDIGWAKPS